VTRSTSRRILLVEDEVGVRDLLRYVLEKEGYRVVAVADGRTAIRALELLESPDEHYCVVCLDLMLPYVPGLDVIGYIEREQLSLPVVAMSANRNLLSAAVEAGARVAVAKPLAKLEDLLSVIVHHCSRKHD
jgi:CheY-like chemotaxis protein